MAKEPSDNEYHGDSLRNHILIAMPSLRDPIFANAITYICDHGSDGAMGLVVSKTLDIQLADVFEQMDLDYNPELGRQPILAGGPVSPQRGFVLHKDKGAWQSSIQITPEVTVTASRDIINAMSRGEGPPDAQFVLGYAGWGAGQLEQELLENNWLTIPADIDILFHTPIEQRWHTAAQRLGVDLHLLHRSPGHA